MRVGGPHHNRAQAPHLFLQQSDGVIELVDAKLVGADQLGEPVGLVNCGRSHRPHLVEGDTHAARGGLPRCFRAGKPSANDVNHEGLRPKDRAEGLVKE